MDETVELLFERRRDLATRKTRYTHEQIDTGRGFTVDRGIADIVHSLWVLGLETQFSCEGTYSMIDHDAELSNDQYFAHVIFTEYQDAFTFFGLVVDNLGSLWADGCSSKNIYVGGLMRDPQSPKAVGARAIVLFHPKHIAAIGDMLQRQIASGS